MQAVRQSQSSFEAIPIEFSFSQASKAVWRPSVHNGLLERDLNLCAASAGQMRASELKAEKATILDGWAGAKEATFLFLYPLSGQITFRFPDGESVDLKYRDVVHLPFLLAAISAECSQDFSAVEIAAPGDRDLAEIAPLLQIPNTPLTGKWEEAVTRNRKEFYIQGNGPRSYFTYRDVGTTGLTDRRVLIHDGGAVREMEGGTGWHNHSMSQLFVVLGGEAVLNVEGHGATRMVKGDAMTIGSGTRHNVSSFTAEYSAFEMCLPADYDTVDQPAP